MKLSKSLEKKYHLRLLTAFLMAYFLIFSCFALYHLYAENEIFDAHECVIGLWVQQGQATLTFFAALALFLSLVLRKLIFRTQRFVTSCFFQYTPRGPPLKLATS